MRVWHALWLDRIDRNIARLERRKADEKHGRKRRPPTPEWVVEVGIGTGRRPVQVHVGTCHITGQTLRQTLDALVTSPQRLVLDLRHVTFMDSTGINILIAAHQSATDAGGWLRLAGPTAP